MVPSTHHPPRRSPRSRHTPTSPRGRSPPHTPQVYGITPDQMPPDLRATVLQALNMAPTVVAACVRSGCVHLTASLLATAEEAALVRGARAGPASALLRGMVQGSGGGGLAQRRQLH